MGLAESNRLTLAERDEFTSLKRALKGYEKSCWAYFETLAKIHAGKLYRESYASFDEFVEKETPFGKSRVYQLIEACEVRKQVSTIVDVLPNEGQARELTKADPEQRAEVWQKAVEKAESEGVPVTAKIVKQVREEVAPTVEPEPEPEREPGDEPPSLEEHVAEAKVDCDKVRNAITAAMTLVQSIEELPGLEILHSRRRRINEHLENAKNEVIVATPACVCPRCDGDGCPQCGNHGWVNLNLKRQLEKAEK